MLIKWILEQNIDINEVKDMIGDTPLIQTSMLKQEGIDELEIQIRDLLLGGEVQNQDMTYVSNSRHISLLKQARTTKKRYKMRLMQQNLVSLWIWYKN